MQGKKSCGRLAFRFRYVGIFDKTLQMIFLKSVIEMPGGLTGLEH